MIRFFLRFMAQRLFHNSVHCAAIDEAADAVVHADDLSIEPVWCPPAPKSTSRSTIPEVPLIADPLGIVFSAAALNAAALKRVPTPEPSNMQPHPTYVCDVDEVLAEGADESVNCVGMFYS